MGISHAYGTPPDKKEMTELLAQAVDIGCNFFDTAEIYGTPENPHDNEEFIGAADVIKEIDDALDNMEMSAVYGGAPIK